MALSGSYDFKLNRDQLIKEVLSLIGEYAPGEAISSADANSCSNTLNMMLKAWQAKGIGLWQIRDCAMFFSEDGYSYTLGPTGSHATESYVKTEVATAASSGATSLVLDSISGISNGDNVGVELDDGSLQWTTINGVPASSTIVLTAALTDDVAVDNHVYTYTTILQRPLEIIEARLHRSDDTEIPLSPVSRDEYKALAYKTSSGTPNQYYYDPQLTNGKMLIWQAAAYVNEWMTFSAKLPFQDLDKQSHDFEFPPEWFQAIVYNGARQVAPKFGRTLAPDTIAMAIEFYQDVSDFDREQASVFINVE